MTTTLYLDGIKAYISRFGIASRKVNKGDFESLINDSDNVIDVIVNRDTAVKYARRMNRLGYLLTAKAEYDMFTFKLTYQALQLGRVTPPTKQGGNGNGKARRNSRKRIWV